MNTIAGTKFSNEELEVMYNATRLLAPSPPKNPISDAFEIRERIYRAWKVGGPLDLTDEQMRLLGAALDYEEARHENIADRVHIDSALKKLETSYSSHGVWGTQGERTFRMEAMKEALEGTDTP